MCRARRLACPASPLESLPMADSRAARCWASCMSKGLISEPLAHAVRAIVGGRLAGVRGQDRLAG